LVPLTAGLFWKRATIQGALFSIILGLTVWISLETHAHFNELADQAGFWESAFHIMPQVFGLFASIVGMLLGSFLPQWISNPEVKYHLHHEHGHPHHIHPQNHK
jgi:SSS family solute:Na+ symporter